MAELIDFGSKIQYSNESPMRWGSEQAISGANKIRDYNRQRAVEKAVSDNYNPETQRVDEVSLGKQLAGQGFGGTAEQVINQIKAERTKMSSDVADAIMKDEQLVVRELMSPERFFEKWGRGVSVKASNGQTQTQTLPQTVSPTIPTKTASDVISEKFPTSFPFQSKTATSETISEPSVVNVPGNDFVSKAEEGKLQDIIPETTYTTTKNDPSTTTGYLGLDRAPKTIQERFPGTSTSTDSSKGVFSTESMTPDEKNNVTRLLARYQIDMTGKTLEEGIGELVGNAVDAVPKPVAINYMVKDLPTEISRFNKENSDYSANVAKAVNEVRKEIKQGYSEVQGTTLAAQGGELAKKADARAAEAQRMAKEDQEFRLAQQKGELYTRPVSPVEAAKVYKITDEYDDITAAAKDPKSFEKAWNAAVSLIKMQGDPVTLDNIMSYLVSMKAYPSRDFADLKRELGTSVDWSGRIAEGALDGIKGVAVSVGASKGAKGADADYMNSQIDKFNSILKKNGGKPMPKVYVQGSTASSSSDSAKKGNASGAIADKKAESNSKKDVSKPSTETPEPSLSSRRKK